MARKTTTTAASQNKKSGGGGGMKDSNDGKSGGGASSSTRSRKGGSSSSTSGGGGGAGGGETDHAAVLLTGPSSFSSSTDATTDLPSNVKNDYNNIKKHSDRLERDDDDDDDTNTTTSSLSSPYHLSSTIVYFSIVSFMFGRCVSYAYDIRMLSILEYGPVIHEFDPYFNWRATEVRCCCFVVLLMLLKNDVFFLAHFNCVLTKTNVFRCRRRCLLRNVSFFTIVISVFVL
jgi:hypothetical protein